MKKQSFYFEKEEVKWRKTTIATHMLIEKEIMQIIKQEKKSFIKKNCNALKKN